MTSEKKQSSEDKLLQELKNKYPQLSKELTEVMKRHGLAEMSEIEIRLTPIKESTPENSENARDFSSIIRQPILKVCILTDLGPQCIP